MGFVSDMTISTTDFSTHLAHVASKVELFLESLLSDDRQPGEIERPQRLMAAMRHAALGGGKRIRPFLTIETARLFGAEEQAALRVGAAIELLHCYSLVHDDLPTMDDDDLRRGRPTVHRAFDEATAILAGDALLTLSFEVLADPATHSAPAVRADLVAALAKAAGLGGMVGGQILDLAAEGRYGSVSRTERDIRRMQAMKTGALLAFSTEAGAIAAQASVSDRANLVVYGKALGAAFQIADDLLDREASMETVGKRTGKDREMGKGTLVDLLGIDGARKDCNRLRDEALAALEPYGEKAERLRQAVHFTVERRA